MLIPRTPQIRNTGITARFEQGSNRVEVSEFQASAQSIHLMRQVQSLKREGERYRQAIRQLEKELDTTKLKLVMR